ncbi:hypothetical protein [Nocardioides sp.]|uniref:hypothetical protein n=1 Tax=Nocardioides sp. TaxID=35761 RepID=UPI003512312A
MITPALVSRAAVLRVRRYWADGVGRGARLRAVAADPTRATWADVVDLLAHHGVPEPHLAGFMRHVARLEGLPVTPTAVWWWVQAHDGIALLDLLDAALDDAELARRLRGPVVSRLVGRTA